MVVHNKEDGVVGAILQLPLNGRFSHGLAAFAQPNPPGDSSRREANLDTRPLSFERYSPPTTNRIHNFQGTSNLRKNPSA